ncbi:MAG: FxLYD domain-containing protein [Candidatus Solibacter sp.]
MAHAILAVNSNMMKRIREFLESIAYTGLKPSGGPATAPKQAPKWLGPLQGSVERLLAGGPAPNDPLYLTNRTTAQKFKAWSLIGIPCLILVAGIGIALYIVDPPEPKPVTQTDAGEITAKVLPDVGKDGKMAPTTDLQVIEIVVSNSRVTGVIQNTGKREIAGAELVIDLTNSAGSQVGAVNAVIAKIPASGRRDFSIGIKQRDAAYALVREIITK